MTEHDTMAAQLAEAERKVELAEWLSYQRTRHPGLRDEQIIGSLAYVPEWRDHAARACRWCVDGVGADGRDCMFCHGTGTMEVSNEHVTAIKHEMSYSASCGDGVRERVTKHADALAAQLAAAEARCQTPPQVWAVVALDYDDYPVGAPLSYHWTEQGAKDWAWQHGLRHPARAVVRTISVNADLPADGSDDDGRE